MTRKTGCRRGRIAVRPRADALACLRAEGQAAIASGNLEVAEAAYRRAIDLGIEDPDVFNNLATIYDRWGVKPDEEAMLLRKACELAPGNRDIRRNRLNFVRRQYDRLTKEARYREALPFARERVELEADSAAAQREFGWCCWKCGSMEDALVHITRAISLSPNNACYYNDLGLVCYDLRLLAEAQGAFQEVLRLSPNSPVAFLHLGLLAHLAGLTGLAISFLKRALAVSPDRGEVHNNIALFYREQGDQKECRHHYQEAVRLRPGATTTLSNYLLSLNDDPDVDPAWAANEHRRFDKLLGGPNRVVRPLDLDPGRKLRVGYLSPDFRIHSVAFFIASVLACHDQEQVETFAYYTGCLEDGVTERIRKSVNRFNTVYRKSDDDLAASIIGDRIDVLVDLSGHTADNRMAMLAKRVAPVQVSYLGYPNTTGLSQMDCRITDALADPPGLSDEWCTERLVRIEGGFLAYQPFDAARALPVAEAPAASTGHVTFGSFNNLGKINDGVLDAWATILSRVPGSVLLLKARGLRSEMVKQRIGAAFAARGVDAEGRVRLMGHERAPLDHLRVYNLIDVALDTFPYNGTTTTCEALWMGTPVVTYQGDRHAARVGTSILTHAGLSSLVAKDRQDYVDLAVALGTNLDKLAEVRRGLREKLAGSPVMDSTRLARGLERAYREAWQRYCSCASTASRLG